MTFFQSYPIELQTQGDHFENPLAPYETLINYEDLSETAKQIMVNNGVNSKSYCQKKLIADFRDRVEYVVHIENLQYYLQRGRVSNKMRSENILVIFLKKLQNLPSRTTDLILLLSLKGLKLTKIHEIISFTQTNFAEKFINTTTKLRAGTSSKVLKSMWKFFNNVLFVSIKKYLE